MSTASPPTWLRALATWLVIFPSVALGQVVLNAVAPSMQPVLRVAVLTGIVVPFAVYIGVPNILRVMSLRSRRAPAEESS